MIEDPQVERLDVSAFTIPTRSRESDGTLDWSSTTIVVVEVASGAARGTGYAYTHAAAAAIIDTTLRPCVELHRALDVGAAWQRMQRAVRNIGRPGVASSAVAAVDVALWDLKARLLEVPLVVALDARTESVPAYGSGGFLSASTAELCRQMMHWVDEGMEAVKMKIGADMVDNIERVRAARRAIGDEVVLMVDANGALDRKDALRQSEMLAEADVRWFEEPVSSDDLDGLRLLRDRAPGGMHIAAGEYGYDAFYFRRMLRAGAVDVLQIDATRAGGITGFLTATALAQAEGIRVSAHTAPNIHTHVCCAAPGVLHVECFHDHVRIEETYFDGAIVASRGRLTHDRNSAGMGIRFRHDAATPYRVY